MHSIGYIVVWSFYSERVKQYFPFHKSRVMDLHSAKTCRDGWIEAAKKQRLHAKIAIQKVYVEAYEAVEV